MRLRPVAAMLLVALLGGCRGQGINQAVVFVPQSGPVTFRVQTDQRFAEVRYLVDGRQVALGLDPINGYVGRYDTRSLSNGLHEVMARGVTREGGETPLFQHAFWVQN